MKFLVVGQGSMGKRRVRNLQALGHTDIVGFDPRADRAAESSEKHSIKTLTNWSDASALPAEAWIISTPPDTHMDYALQAVDRGIHFFTEANVTDERVPELLQKIKGRKLVAAPSSTLRYYPGPKRIREWLRSGAIGRPLSFTYQSGQYLPDWHPWESYKDFYVSKRETGACREIVPFELSWLLPLFGPVNKLSCLRGKVGDLDADIDDVYQLLLRFESGTLGHLLVDVVARPAVRLFRLNGTEGTIEWDHTLRRVRLWRAGTKAWEEVDLGQGTVEKGYIHAEEPYIEEMADFVAAIRGERPWPYSYEDDEAVLDLLVKAERSSDTGRHT